MENSYNMATVFSKTLFNFSCIYKITSPSGKIYIGQTQCLYKRFQNYRKRKANKYLMKAILKYGLENMMVDILEKDVELGLLDEREQFYLDMLQPFGDNGYNICKKAGTTRGRKRPQEEMKGSSEFNKTKVGELNHFYGKRFTEETKQKLREGRIGKKMSEETIRKIKENTDHSPKYKCVVQMDLKTNEIINEFKSITEAHNKTGVSISSISAVVSGKAYKTGDTYCVKKSAGGFYWKSC